MTSESASVWLAGLRFVLSADELPLALDPDPAYRSFFAPPPPSSAFEDPPVVRLRHSVVSAPDFDGETIFESAATWSIRARGSERAFAFRHPDGEMLFVAAFRPGSPEVTVACAPRLGSGEGRHAFLASPFHYPFDQVLTMYLLAERGVVVHAAGALARGQGLTFAGISGAGKSTLTALAAPRPHWTPLSDDRVIVRTGNGGPGEAMLGGTPWPGEGRAAANDRGPLTALFFLEQGSANEVRRLAPKDALGRLLRTVSVPWYDAEYLGGVLAACGAVVAQVPTAVLTFRPEAGAVDAVERFLAETVEAREP